MLTGKSRTQAVSAKPPGHLLQILAAHLERFHPLPARTVGRAPDSSSLSAQFRRQERRRSQQHCRGAPSQIPSPLKR